MEKRVPGRPYHPAVNRSAWRACRVTQALLCAGLLCIQVGFCFRRTQGNRYFIAAASSRSCLLSETESVVGATPLSCGKADSFLTEP